MNTVESLMETKYLPSGNLQNAPFERTKSSPLNLSSGSSNVGVIC